MIVCDLCRLERRINIEKKLRTFHLRGNNEQGLKERVTLCVVNHFTD